MQHRVYECAMNSVDELKQCLIMVALWNRANHYIFIMWILLLLLSIFFPRLISAVADWMYVCHTSTNGVALVRI